MNFKTLVYSLIWFNVTHALHEPQEVQTLCAQAYWQYVRPHIGTLDGDEPHARIWGNRLSSPDSPTTPALQQALQRCNAICPKTEACSDDDILELYRERKIQKSQGNHDYAAAREALTRLEQETVAQQSKLRSFMQKVGTADMLERLSICEQRNEPCDKIMTSIAFITSRS